MDKILDKFLEYQLPSGNPTWQWNMFEDDFPSYKARFTLGYSRRGVGTGLQWLPLQEVPDSLPNVATFRFGRWCKNHPKGIFNHYEPSLAMIDHDLHIIILAIIEHYLTMISNHQPLLAIMKQHSPLRIILNHQVPWGAMDFRLSHFQAYFKATESKIPPLLSSTGVWVCLNIGWEKVREGERKWENPMVPYIPCENWHKFSGVVVSRIFRHPSFSL